LAPENSVTGCPPSPLGAGSCFSRPLFLSPLGPKGELQLFPALLPMPCPAQGNDGREGLGELVPEVDLYGKAAHH
jgi:hypothetical protein